MSKETFLGTISKIEGDKITIVAEDKVNFTKLMLGHIAMDNSYQFINIPHCFLL